MISLDIVKQASGGSLADQLYAAGMKAGIEYAAQGKNKDEALIMGLDAATRRAIGGTLGALLLPSVVASKNIGKAKTIAIPISVIVGALGGANLWDPQPQYIPRTKFSITPPPGARRLHKRASVQDKKQRTLTSRDALILAGTGALGGATAYGVSKLLAKNKNLPAIASLLAVPSAMAGTYALKKYYGDRITPGREKAIRKLVSGQ